MKMLQEIRQTDPFHFFSIPGALRYEFLGSGKDGTDAVELLLPNLANASKQRKTRVSCEIHSIDIHQEIMREIQAEMRIGNERQDVTDRGTDTANGRNGRNHGDSSNGEQQEVSSVNAGQHAWRDE